MISLLILVFSISKNQAHGMFTAVATTTYMLLTVGEALLPILHLQQKIPIM